MSGCRMCGSGPCVGGEYGDICPWWRSDPPKKTYAPDPKPQPKPKKGAKK